MSIFEATPEEQRDHMLRHTVKAKDVPVGMTFYTNYDDYNLNNESGAKVMNEALYYTYTEYGFDSDAPIDPEQDVYVSKPELCGVAVVPEKQRGVPLVPGDPQSEYNAMMERRDLSAVDKMKPLQEQFNRKMEGVPDSPADAPGSLMLRGTDHQGEFSGDTLEFTPWNGELMAIVHNGDAYVLNAKDEQRLRDFLNARA